MRVSFDVPEQHDIDREMPMPPRQGEKVYLNDEMYEVTDLMWEDPDTTDEQEVAVHLKEPN